MKTRIDRMNLTSFGVNPKFDVRLLRLDLLHPEAQGNKWFKLKYNLEKARKDGRDTLLSFGGAWSNHLHALALTGRKEGFKTIGIVRGEEPKLWSDTLLDCKAAGMDLHFISRAEYKEKNENFFKQYLRDRFGSFHLIPEGGSNFHGVNGTLEIVGRDLAQEYDLIACPVGTGATLAGIALSSGNTPVLGFPALAQGAYLRGEIEQQLLYFLFDEESVAEVMENLHLHLDGHCGGFAKVNEELLQFQKKFQQTNQVELDLLYTAKMMMALCKELQKEDWAFGTKILCVHTGGLQGNRGVKGYQQLQD
jgi:1-aminocyclopropane-1-carboxylate deaminase